MSSKYVTADELDKAFQSIERRINELKNDIKYEMNQIEVRNIEKARVVKDALDKAENTLNDRLSEMNQFREQLTSERALYVTRDQLSLTLKPINDAISPLQSSQSFNSGRDWTLVFVVGVVVAGIEIISRIWGH
jgi:hypothetical protein